MNPFKLIGPLFEAMKKGEEVKNADIVKNGSMAAQTIAGLLTALIALAVAFGVQLPAITPEEILLWSTAIGSVAHFGGAFLTMITSKRVGIGGEKPPEQP